MIIAAILYGGTKETRNSLAHKVKFHFGLTATNPNWRKGDPFDRHSLSITGDDMTGENYGDDVAIVDAATLNFGDESK